ncbi:hypothetical protein M6B38_305835 [Iris pallida]|uniref:Uncharacterized protein n=1 Tax=Iris pallida TaxID=29817 RepID=A0AAX6HNI1_IRIPA|nr:hypothetical protein M6B38_305835 [Iris pallida]
MSCLNKLHTLLFFKHRKHIMLVVNNYVLLERKGHFISRLSKI